MGEDPSRRKSEIDVLRLGLDLGVMLIDTAEMYGEGGAEEVIGEAIKDRNRKEIFIVTKVYPHNATRRGENRAALDIKLTDRDLKELDEAFPPPNQKVQLEMV